MRALLRRPTLRLRKLVTVTTRPPRPGEVKGHWYHFVSEAEFDARLKRGDFLEWAPVRGYKFGTPKEPLRTWLTKGYRVIQQIDVRGAASLSRVPWIRAKTIFILPGSVTDLKNRLQSKHFSPEQRKIRWQETVNELKQQVVYDFRVVNEWGKLKEAVDEAALFIRMIR